jgi:hypothetical protein
MPNHLTENDLIGRFDSDRFEDIFRRPEMVFDPPWIFSCKVTILIVTDSSGGFGTTQSFHLGHVIDVLQNDPWLYVNFDIAKAHRQVSAESGVIDNFRFDSHDLTQYDQIWLFGVTSNQDPLSQSELKALAQFMDSGGGVFATGDHEDLGKAMAAEVPRVRSMRRWYWPNPGPNGEPVAPDISGPDRHDTVMNNSAGGTQSDKIPQPINPKLYKRTSGGPPIYTIISYPHPVLCGPDGRVTYLPDHMHEGLVEVPSDLTQSFTFAGYTTQEYPNTSSGRVAPEVIAEATTRNTDGSQYGVIGAYDGHNANVGRVVVDATWHHWFNINVETFVQVTDPTNPNYDPAVVPKWDDIKAYYQNVAKWLAPPHKQSCMRSSVFFTTLGHNEVKMALGPLDSVRDQNRYYWQLGEFAQKAVALRASGCEGIRWVVDIEERLIPSRVNPWEPEIPEPQPRPDPPPWLNLEDLDRMALGGAVQALWEKFGEAQGLQRLVEQNPDEAHEVALEGAARATGQLWERQIAAAEEAREFQQYLVGCGKGKPG